MVELHGRVAIAIQGERGSFSHEATLVFQAHAVIRPCSLSAEAFRLLDAGEVEAAVLPIENSLAGPVVEHYDLLWQHDVKAEREIRLRIKHCLIGMQGSTIESIQRVYSHPVALAQCRKFLAEHPYMEALPAYDTAGSVKRLIEGRDSHAAAVASMQAASTYNGAILASGIEDDPENYTRFFLLRRPEDLTVHPSIDKLSVAFTVAHRPGTLVGALEVIAEEKANLTNIQSRPVHGQPWHYVFYADCLVTGHEMADRVLEGLRAYCSVVKELGRYQAAKE